MQFNAYLKEAGHCCLRIPSFLFTMSKNRSAIKNRERRSLWLLFTHFQQAAFFEDLYLYNSKE